ncbi:hypothetical protein BDQ12DRAFT_634900 [Crucibulum laeve]|uniref:F-box domain-containing protein n=1 Tax=Crucibulum laeve TaxID=68775 RepID=A0A5C3LUE6_9AGAR|nr:hypothetical protein BDQ12DRAFT_634900 [Crucibulum laeve]
MNILKLPNEILINVLVISGAAGVRSCARTNRTLRDIVVQSIELQYLLELEQAGLSDNPECVLPIHERLELLNRREDAWATFKYDFRTTISMPQQSSGLYDVSSGSLFLGLPEDIQDGEALGIQYASIFSVQNERLVWRNVKVGMTVLEFVTSIREHDLIALVVSYVVTPNSDNSRISNISVVFIRYSTGEYHDIPKKHAFYICSFKESYGNPNIALEIVGDNMVCAVENPGRRDDDSLYIFKWKTGTQIFPVLTTHDVGIVFLREDIFFISNSLFNSIDIYQIPNSSDDIVMRIRSLRLPALKPGVFIEHFACRSEPNCRGDHQFIKNVSSSKPFYENPENAIIIFSIDFGHHSFIMITHRRSLLDLALQVLIPRDLRWEAWGPLISRWFNTHNHETEFITITNGQRLLRYPRKGSSTYAPIRILDFNPYRIHLARGKRQAKTKKSVFSLFHRAISFGSSASSRVADLVDVNEKNICNASGCFLTHIYSTLPYVQCCSSETFNYHALIMDDERIIGTWCEEDDCVGNKIEALHMG